MLGHKAPGSKCLSLTCLLLMKSSGAISYLWGLLMEDDDETTAAFDSKSVGLTASGTDPAELDVKRRTSAVLKAL